MPGLRGMRTRVFHVLLTFIGAFGSEAEPFYTLVIDAGSSGSRLRVYNHVGSAINEVIPEKEDKDEFETTPGLSAYASEPSKAGPSLQGLLDAAQKLVPEGQVSSSRIWVMATAGVRSVAADLLQGLTSEVDKYMSNAQNCPFKFEEFDIIGGEREAVYAWLALNSITKALDDDSKPTVGILELGGSSMQIGFGANTDVFAHEFHVYVNNRRIAMSAQSFPQFGINDMMQRAHAAAVPEGQSEADPIDFACFNREYAENVTVGDSTYEFRGTGDSDKCAELVDTLMAFDYECLLPPCSFRGTHISAIPVDKKFYALASWFFLATNFGLVGWSEAKAVTPQAILDATKTFCGQTKSEAEAGKSSPWSFIKKYCMAGHYAYKAFTAFGFEPESANIIFARKVDGQSAGWTSGAARYEAESMPKVRETCKDSESPGQPANPEGVPIWVFAVIGMQSLLLVLAVVVYAKAPRQDASGTADAQIEMI